VAHRCAAARRLRITANRTYCFGSVDVCEGLRISKDGVCVGAYLGIGVNLLEAAENCILGRSAVLVRSHRAG
jgi:hypothetical protein